MSDLHCHLGGEGPALVLLNGWTSPGTVWRHSLLSDLQKRFLVIRPDNRGTGLSYGNPTSLAAMATETVGALDRLGVAEFVLAGASMGGMIAQELALLAPDRVRGLVLVASAPPHPAQIGPSSEMMAGISKRRLGVSMRQFVIESWSSLTAPGFFEREPELASELTRLVLKTPTPMAASLAQALAIKRFAGPERLGAITAPTVVVHGARDPLLVIENARRLVERIAGAELCELATVGHLVAWEDPARLSEIVVDLARVVGLIR